MKISIPNLSLDLHYEYAVLSDPPIFADFGASVIEIDNLYIEILSNTSFENQNLTVNVIDMNIGLNQMNVDFDGVSDMSLVITSLVNDIVKIVGQQIHELLLDNKPILINKT